MHKKKIYHRLTGVASFLIGVFAIIFSLFLMPIGGSRAQTPVTATFLDGARFHNRLREFATLSNIQQIVRTGSLAQGFTTGLLSTADSEVPIIAWYDNGILYYYTEADVLYLNNDSSGIFQNMKSVSYIDTSGWNTSHVTKMGSMFDYCENLTGLDVSDWDTSNVTGMMRMFYMCESLTELDVSKWDTSSVTTMYHMFSYCESLTGLDVSDWDTSNVTNMWAMFERCRGLTELDVSKWDTSNVTDMGAMFNACTSLTELDVSRRDTSNVTNMQGLFSSTSLTELDLRSWDTSKVTNMSRMFNGNFHTIYASTGFVTSGVADSANIFNTPKLIGGHGTKYPSLGTTKSGAVVDSEFASGYLTYDIAVSYRTRSGVELTRQIINVGSSAVAPSITGYNVLGYYSNTGLSSTFDFSQELRKYTEVYVDWDGCDTGYLMKNGFCVAPVTATFKEGPQVNTNLKSLATGSTVTSTNSVDTLIQQIVRTGAIAQGFTTGLLSTPTSEVPIIAWYDNGILYYYSDADIIYLNQDSNAMFTRITSVTYIDTSGWDTSRVTNMSSMFRDCSSLESLDVSNFDTSNVTEMNLMFYFCNSLESLDVSNFDTSSVTEMTWMFLECNSITELDVSKWDMSSVTKMAQMFGGCNSLESLDVSNWDTSSVTTMYAMFHSCSNLTSLDVSNWNTSSVTSMGTMFAGCNSLTELDLSNFDTSRVTNMGSMFYSCRNLETIYVSTGFITSGVTSSTNMFNDTNKLIGGHGTKYPSLGTTKSGAVLDSETQSGYLTYDIAVSYRTRSGVELARQVINVGDTTVAPSITGYNMMGYYMNSGLTTPFDFSQELRTYTEVYVDRVCADGYRLADGVCEKILTATFLPGQTVNKTLKSLATGATVTNYWDVDTLIQQIVRTGSIPAGVTTGLLSTNDSETPIIAWFDNGILYYYSDADILYLNQSSNNMFYNIKSGTYIDTSGWDTSKVTNMYNMFYGCRSLTGLDVSGWNTSSVTNMFDMFQSCSSLTGLDVSRWNTSKVTDMTQMFQSCSSLTGLDVSNWDTSKVTNMHGMFQSCSSLTGLDVSRWNTSKVTDMAQMFDNCSSLTELDLSKWDTSKVTNMSWMFRNCSSLTLLDVSSWDTSKVITMAWMFQQCSSLTGLDVSNFDTTNVENMKAMFYMCSSLENLDVSNFDTSVATDMSQMFYGCSSLTGLDVSNFDTTNVTDMSHMFYGCRSLTGLDVSNFYTSKVTSMNSMFGACINLEIIYASTGFITSGVTNSSSMFSNTHKLIGGHGTKYDRSYIDKTLAVLDSETESGYLTYDIAVSYRTKTGLELARQVINVGDTTVAPSIIRTGYAVSGWYIDTGLTTLFDFSQSLRKYTELYVMWKCDTGYMLSGDGVTCIPLTYEVRHFIKNAGELSYTLSGTEIFTGIAGEQVYFDDLSQTYPSCIVYSRGSLTGDENGPGEIETKTDIAGDGSTVINLFYDRNTYTVDLSRDFGIGMVEGAGTYECGQEVQIRAYPIDGYHFDMWEGEVD